MQRGELSADGELAGVDVDSDERHVGATLVDVLQRSAEATAHVQDVLSVTHIGHVDEDLGEPLDGGLNFLDVWRPIAIGRRGVIPMSHVDKTAGHTVVKALDEEIEVRRYSGRHVCPRQ
jgi:hypothetical protein